MPLLAVGLMKHHTLIDSGTSIYVILLYNKLTNIYVVQSIIIHMTDNSSHLEQFSWVAEGANPLFYKP